MRETADRTGWGTEEIHHKEQELSWESSLTVKDHILKKCPWFYEFEDIFHKHPGINPPLIIESGQPPRREGVTIDENDLGGYDFDLDQDLEDPCETASSEKEKEDEEDIDISFSNPSNVASDSDSSLHSVFSQIARDERRKTRKETSQKINKRSER